MKKVIYIIILWALMSIAFCINQESIKIFGTKVLLKTSAYDPRDILRGDYANLRFDIETLYDNENKIDKNDKYVYVILETDKDNIAHIKSYSNTKPKNELFIKGKIYIKHFKDKKYTLRYGIEHYFVDTNSKTLRKNPFFKKWSCQCCN